MGPELEILIQRARTRPTDWTAWYELAIGLDDAGERRAAQDAFERAQEVARHPVELMEVGAFAEARGFIEVAVSAFRRATRHASGAPDEAHRRLGRALLAAGEIDAAVMALRVAADRDKEDARSWSALAEALLRANRYEEALRAAEQAVDVNYDDPVGHRVLSRINARMGRDEDVVEALRNLTIVDPGDTSAVLALGRALIAADEPDEGRQVLIALGESQGRLDSAPLPLLIALGEALLGLGEVDRGILCLERALRMQPDSTEARLALARATEAATSLEDADLFVDAQYLPKSSRSEDEGPSTREYDPASSPSWHWLSSVFAFDDPPSPTPRSRRPPLDDEEAPGSSLKPSE